MTAWTSDKLDKIGTAEELEIVPLQRNGARRNPVTIWVVRSYPQYVAPMVAAEVRATTLKLVPRTTST
jgi:hypothetical protein